MKLRIALFLIGWIIMSTPGFAQNVNQGEYFFNSYVDFGNGTVFTISQGEASLDLDISSLPDGLNLLYTRVKDNQGIWSHTNQSVFYKYEAQTGLQISEIEYMIDEYKDFGSGNKLALEEGKDDYLIDLKGLDEGLHILFVRAKNNSGIWSLLKKSVFYIYDDEPSNIITLSYQFIGEGFESPVYAFGEFEPATEVVLEQNQFMANAEGLEEGKTYKILLTAKNEKGQQSMVNTISFTYTEVEPIIISDIETTDLTCFEANDGSVTISATFEEGELEYSLDNETFQSANIFENLAAGDYTAYVRSKDNPTNAIQRNFTISSPDDIAITISDITSPTCPDTETGSFKVSATGGTGVFTYKLDSDSEFQNSDVFNELAAGDYTVEVKDENGCIKSSTLTILPPVEIAVSISSAVGPVCPDDATGTITVSATGGSGGYTFKLSTQNDFQTGNTFEDLEAGTYTVTAKDSNGCEKSTEVQLDPTGEVPPVPTISIQGTDGISTEVILMSSSPTNNQWFRDGSEIPGETGQSLEITQPGSYQVRVTGESGCSSLSEVTVITSSPEVDQLKVKLYPNPAEHSTKISFGRETLIDRIVIYSSSGIILRDMNEQMMVEELELDLSGLSSGSYIIQVEAVGLFERIKLIKQ
jgi:hypothetical protein